MSVPTLTISIVHHANRQMLRDCLRSIFETEQGVDFEIVLVDNLSREGALEMVREEFPAVRVIENQTQQGFGANHNQALRIARGRFILLLNDDTLVRPNALRVLCEYLENHPQVGAVGPRLENPDGSLQPNCYKFPTPFRALVENLLLVAALPNHRVIGDYRAWPHDAQREVDFVSGAAFLVRREVLESAGLFDEDFFMYYEESDWCLRMQRCGWRVAFTPDATVVHHGGQSSVEFRERQAVEFHRSLAHYFQKNFGATGVGFLRASMICGALLRVTLWSGVLALSALGVRRVSTPRLQTARAIVRQWRWILKWWIGAGSRQGLRQLAARHNSKPNKK